MRSKLLYLGQSLEDDLAGLIGCGVPIGERAFAEFLVHFVDGAHELRVVRLVEQIGLMLFLGGQAREVESWRVRGLTQPGAGQ